MTNIIQSKIKSEESSETPLIHSLDENAHATRRKLLECLHQPENGFEDDADTPIVFWVKKNGPEINQELVMTFPHPSDPESGPAAENIGYAKCGHYYWMSIVPSYYRKVKLDLFDSMFYTDNQVLTHKCKVVALATVHANQLKIFRRHQGLTLAKLAVRLVSYITDVTLGPAKTNKLVEEINNQLISVLIGSGEDAERQHLVQMTRKITDFLFAAFQKSD